MGRWSIKGRWFGEYTYDPMSEYPEGFLSASFILDIEEEWSGKFRGSVQDDPLQGSPEPGVIKGKVVGESLEFVKQMPVFYLLMPEGLRTLEECVREWWGMDFDYPVHPPHVRYEGEFSPDGEEMAGTWWYANATVLFPSGGQCYSLDFARVSGRWHARRGRSSSGVRGA